MYRMKPSSPIRVAVASDQDIFRRGLVSMVMSLNHSNLVGEARDGAEALQLCERVIPDILLLDLKSLAEEGKAMVAEIHQRWPEVKVVFMLGSQEESQCPEEPECEGIIYMSKDISEQEFNIALQDIHRSLPLSMLPAPSDSIPAQPFHAQPVETIIEVQQRELKMAGRIQADILPEKVPAIPGWDVAARLISARETSGDFFDFIPLSPQHWAIVIGDVTDKGIGAALFMALTSSLIRTYAVRYPTLPALAMDMVNQRMLSDTRGSMFVTAFYGVLEPKLGRLRYVNAGHPPAFVVGNRGAKPVDQLKPTGMALGLVEKTNWRQKVTKFLPGDTLLLYTDGITEAQNRSGDFYGEERLMKVLRSTSRRSTERLLEAILADVQDFTGSQPQHDDIALVAICRRE